jgi:hypothetical protein
LYSPLLKLILKVLLLMKLWKFNGTNIYSISKPLYIASS